MCVDVYLSDLKRIVEQLFNRSFSACRMRLQATIVRISAFGDRYLCDQRNGGLEHCKSAQLISE